jgi:hypothetical protein
MEKIHGNADEGKNFELSEKVLGAAMEVLNSLKASGIEVGLLINFGNPRLEIRRLSMHKDDGKGTVIS